MFQFLAICRPCFSNVPATAGLKLVAYLATICLDDCDGVRRVARRLSLDEDRLEAFRQDQPADLRAGCGRALAVPLTEVNGECDDNGKQDRDECRDNQHFDKRHCAAHGMCFRKRAVRLKAISYCMSCDCGRGRLITQNAADLDKPK